MKKKLEDTLQTKFELVPASYFKAVKVVVLIVNWL